MSTTLEGRVATVQQRGAEATRRLREALGIDDVKLLSVAVAEVAASEAARNPAFGAQIRAVYQELAEKKAARPTRSRKPSVEVTELVPLVKMEGLRRDPFGPVDPYFLFEVYGGAQLRKALGGNSLERLKEAAEAVEQKTGVKPKGRATKASLTDYIVLHVAGPGY